MRTLPGIDVLLTRKPDLLAGRRLGLVTNPTGVTRDLRSDIDALRSLPRSELVALFGPEHGIRSDVQDGIAVASDLDRRTGLPVHSLYGPQKKPTGEMLSDVDLLIYDMQDVGARFYTYLWTLYHVLFAAAERGLEIIVLDRPNPLGGELVEGPMLDPAFASFVGEYPIPIRYGLTVGELATLFNQTAKANLTVIPMEGWHRSAWYDRTGLPWVLPSPNMPTLDTAIVYPGTCLFEGTNLSEGRGTTKPFEFVGAPWVEAEDLAEALNRRRLPGVAFRPVYFTPTYSKFSGQQCGGVQLHVLDRAIFRPVEAGLYLLSILSHMYPDRFSWLPTSWEGKPPHFDLLMGTDSVRRQLEAGVTVPEIVEGWQIGLEGFQEKRTGLFLY